MVLTLAAACGVGAEAVGEMPLAELIAQRRAASELPTADTLDKVLLDLIVDPHGPGTWEVRATVVGMDGGAALSAGLGDFVLNVTGDGEALVTSSTCEAVEYEPADAAGMAGFSIIRMDHRLGEPGIGIVGVQPAWYEGENDPARDRLVIQGAGIVAGSDESTAGPVHWQREFLVAAGTYEGQGFLTAANCDPDVGWTLLEDKGGPAGLGWYGPSSWELWSQEVVSDTEYVPEPAALALLALGCLPLLRRRLVER